MSKILPAGTPAPEFTLHAKPDQTLALKEFRGRPVILAFYPADWSPVCGDQMALYNEVLPEFQRFNAELLGISVDGVWCHAAFSRDRKLHFPLLADFKPKGAVAKLYGAFRDGEGIAERGLFVIDKNGTIRWSYCSPIAVNPGLMGFSKFSKICRNKPAMAKLRVPVGPDDHLQGPADAPVTLVEYGDYECPHCGHAYPIVKALQKKFGEQLRFALRNFPLREIHPYAEAAAETAEFAATHGKFWEMHDLIFENQNSLSEQVLGDLAQRLTIDRQALRDALEWRAFAERVQRDFSGGVRSGVNGTPTFFINSQRHDGDFELETLRQAINKAAG